jgi:hypothetical protein
LLGPNGWIERANFTVLGVLLIYFALGFSQWMRPVITRGWLYGSTIFLSLSGLGYIMAGIFVPVAPGEPPTALHALLHTAAFDIVFFSLPIACFIVGGQCIRTAGWRGYGWYSLITGLITIMPALANLLFPFAATPHPPAFGGLVERILVAEALAWYVVTSWRFLALERAQKQE